MKASGSLRIVLGVGTKGGDVGVASRSATERIGEAAGTTNPHLFTRLGYDALADFAPVARFGVGQQALGVGVARLRDWHQRPGREVASGLLVPALTEWVVDEVLPVNLLCAPSVRRTPRVRVFLDWVAQLFAEFERERLQPLPATAMPHWAKRKRRRASETRDAPGLPLAARGAQKC